MQEPDFWAASAEAMELTVEGNRLIAREVADMLRNLWHRLSIALTSMMASEHRHLPPI
jgi:hypothetical protein